MFATSQVTKLWTGKLLIFSLPLHEEESNGEGREEARQELFFVSLLLISTDEFFFHLEQNISNRWDREVTEAYLDCQSRSSKLVNAEVSLATEASRTAGNSMSWQSILEAVRWKLSRLL